MTAAHDEARTAPRALYNLSVEVLEHASDAERATREIGRLLAPGGHAVISTPCANPRSFEWLLNRRRDGLQSTPDRVGRVETDEPGHLRRLRSGDLRVLPARAGLVVDRIDYWAQVFMPLAARAPRRLSRRLGSKVLVDLALLDWKLLRRFPNGATMLLVAHRGAGASG
jgi:SAM-dependent methyltransferase